VEPGRFVGTAAFRDLVGAVDFPSFVGGLIQNVFQAIVTASIQCSRSSRSPTCRTRSKRPGW
jgi:hypothetical protein